MVVSAADSLTLSDGTPHPTGFWAEELVVAHRTLVGAGHEVVVATPGGARPTVDAASLDPSQAGSAEKAAELRTYLDDIAAELDAPASLADVDVSGFDAVVLPGGHGPMVDLAVDPVLGRLLTEADAAGTVIAPFCHGPAGLLSATTGNGELVFAGRRVAVFTDEEERTGGTGETTPWFVATRLRERGALVEEGPAWSSFVVRDGNLISGQNPQSSEAVAQAVLEALGAR
jgi:putative intracellular protease/amidase